MDKWAWVKSGFLLAVFVLIASVVNGQDPNEDYTWWNETHGWKPGDPGWRNWLKISPGFMGPNALPVPSVKKGIIEEASNIEITASSHFHRGDPTQDFSGRIFIPFADNKIAVEMYGVIIEHYSFTTEIRDERFARDRDGKGTAMGDFYFSTLIQIFKNRKFPNTLLRLATKTASGNNLKAARYTDSPGYFFDLSFSKNYTTQNNFKLKPFGLAGFYSWQTNDELRLQNDALMYAAGCDIAKRNWQASGSLSGYSGYKNERDRPMQLNFELAKDFINKSVKLYYIHGLRSWDYKTLRISFIFRLNEAAKE
ncbi:MAG: hypothetical protein PHG29_08100 [Prolixibacteraceae bacterium]|jgi:hypothetical protein|nr:hypothetical protein [Prolixibacteraceae bacterium]